MTEQDALNHKCDRRDFMGMTGVATFLGAIGLAGLGSFIGLKPRVLPDPSQQFKIGPPQDFPTGTKRVFDKEQVAVFSDPDGIYAISLVCTHLGCIVTLNAKEGRFDCPCHGSKFTLEGEVTKAPAPKALPWYQVTTDPGGQLMIDRSVEVPMGTKVIA